jgi:hypothetical protein
MSKWAVDELINTYSQSLADIRDRAAKRNRPVESAESLSRYLIKDGLDISTVAAEIPQYLALVRPPEFVQPSYRLRADHADGLPSEVMSSALWVVIKERAESLQRDYNSTVSTVASYAQLRQSTTNTVLQRWVMALTILAIFLAVGGLIIAYLQLVAA